VLKADEILQLIGKQQAEIYDLQLRLVEALQKLEARDEDKKPDTSK